MYLGYSTPKSKLSSAVMSSICAAKKTSDRMIISGDSTDRLKHTRRNLILDPIKVKTRGGVQYLDI
jgi:hypothetical protein